VPRELWIQFEDGAAFRQQESALYDMLRDSEGKDRVVVYVKALKAVKRLSESWGIQIDDMLFGKIAEQFGTENVKVVEKCIENLGKMH